MAYRYKEVESGRARRTPGKSYKAVGKKPRLGSGGRFKALVSVLRRKGVRDPEALAAWRGRQKYGSRRMAKMAAAGRRRSVLRGKS